MSLSTIERREKVHHLLIKGTTETEIAKVLNVSRKTIVRDVKFLKEQTKPWLNDLMKIGAIFECKIVLEKLKDIEKELNKMLQEPNLTVMERSKLLRQKELNIVEQANFVLEGPTFFAMKNHLGDLIKP